MKQFMIFFLIIACACLPIKYEGDLNFINAAQANSNEYMVQIKGPNGWKVCKDIDGIVGQCSKRISSNETIQFKMDAREYGYRFYLRCTKGIGNPEPIDITPGSSHTFVLTPAQYAPNKIFECVGYIYPHDRDQEIYGKWFATFSVYDHYYREREKIYVDSKKGKKGIVFGKHARYVHYNGKRYKKKTMLKLKRKDKVGRGYSESERMRFNYFNY